MRENRRVTAAGWWQDVRNFELDIEDLQDLGDGERLCVSSILVCSFLSTPLRHLESGRYAAGDVLEIRPQNKEEDVEDFLKSTGWIDIADDHFEIEPSNPRMLHFGQDFHLGGALNDRLHSSAIAYKYTNALSNDFATSHHT